MTDLRPSRFSRRTGLGMATSLLAVATVGRVAAQESTPQASPEAIPDLPEGPLGVQIQWLVELLNGDLAEITNATVEPHLDPPVLQENPADGLVAILIDVATKAAPLTVEPQTMTTTEDSPPSAAQFVLQGKDNLRFTTSVAVNSQTGLINGMNIEPATDDATPTI